MTEKKKKQRNPKQGGRQKLGRTTSLDDYLEKIAELTRPSALTDYQDRLDALRQPSALTDFQDRLDKLTRPSALTDYQDRLDALRQPSALTDYQDRLDALTRPSALTDFQDRLDKLTRPSALTDFQDRLDALTRPSALTDFQDRLDKLTRPSALTDFQDRLDALTRPSSLMDFQDRLDKLRRPSALTDIQDRLDKLTRQLGLTDFPDRLDKLRRPSALTDFQDRLDKLTRPLALTDFQDQLDKLTRPSYLDDLQNQFANIAGVATVQTELAAVAGSYQGLMHGSVLASYLAGPEGFDVSDAKVSRVARYDSLDVGDFADLEVDPVRSVDLEIIKAIEEGEVAKLSPTATQRLHSIYLQIVVVWDMLLRIFNTFVALGVLTALMTGASAPADVPERAALLTNEQRVLLADFRMVNREGARLRAEPTTQSMAIASLPFAHPVEVIEYNDKGWYRVETETPDGYLEGWMYVSVTTPVPKPKYLRGQKVDAETL